MLHYEQHELSQVCGTSTQRQTVVLLLNLIRDLHCKGKPVSSGKSACCIMSNMSIARSVADLLNARLLPCHSTVHVTWMQREASQLMKECMLQYEQNGLSHVCGKSSQNCCLVTQSGVWPAVQRKANQLMLP